MHNKRTYTRVFTYAYTRIDIRVYAYRHTRIRKIRAYNARMHSSDISELHCNSSLLSQHPSPYSFYLNAYLVSLEPQTFCFPLDSCPDTLPVSHGDLDTSSTMFLKIHIHCSSNTFPSLNYTNYYTAVHVPQTIYKLILL